MKVIKKFIAVVLVALLMSVPLPGLANTQELAEDTEISISTEIATDIQADGESALLTEEATEPQADGENAIIEAEAASSDEEEEEILEKRDLSPGAVFVMLAGFGAISAAAFLAAILFPFTIFR